MSVVIGSYNRHPFLDHAVESVSGNGAMSRYEVIVVDGGSTDGSLGWLIHQKDIVTIVEHNRGEFRGYPIRRQSWGYFMNFAFRSAQGRYVLMINDDYLLAPGAIDRGVDRFAEVEAEGRKIAGVACYYSNYPQERAHSGLIAGAMRRASRVRDRAVAGLARLMYE